jgi:large subunit ribosomal protein L24
MKKSAKESVRQNKHVREGSKVKVLTGNDKGTIGQVLSRTEDRVIIQGVNVRKKHVRRTQNQPGQIIEIERSINASNVMLVNEQDQPVRAKVRVDANGDKRLISVKDGKEQTLRNIKTQSAK